VAYDSLIDSYLTEAHRDHPGTGCPVGALAGDVARSDKRTQAIATRKIVERLGRLENSIRETSGEDKGTARSLAIMTWCALVGAITLARAVSDKHLSREILKTVAQLLKTSPRNHGRYHAFRDVLGSGSPR
jgi:TetR/AcrR family transcriptional repressor of nem operon